MNKALRRFEDTFNRLNKDNLHLLEEIYAPNLHFRDPFVEIRGLKKYRNYLEKLYRGVKSVHFEFGEEIAQPGRAVLVWTMEWSHPRIKGGRLLKLDGVSHLEFDEKIRFHRDYFDAGEFIYEQLPILGSLVRLVKRSL